MSYLCAIRSAASGGEQSIDVSSLPGMDALSQPGSCDYVLTTHCVLVCSL